MSKSSEKSFGFLFAIVFLIIALWPLLNSNEVRMWALIPSTIFVSLALFKPLLLKPLNTSWIKFGEILGKFIAPIVMGIVFFIVLTPISFILRIFGKDLLKIKYSKDGSYWIRRDKEVGSMRKQF